MQSPPTSPRRRGRLPPKAPWLRPRHRRAEEFIAARMGPAGPLPGRRWNVSAAIRTSPAAVRQLLFFYQEDRAFLHLDVPHDANAAGLIAELDVVASGPDAGDSRIPLLGRRGSSHVPNAIEASNTPRILAPARYALVAWPPSRKASFAKKNARYSAPLWNAWRRQARLAQQTPKMMVAVD